MVELCAGTAALSLRLHRDGAKPPVSRLGAKTGYANVILRVLGLVPGQRAERYLWCEPDPGVRLLLEAYRDATLAREAAAIIRGWAAEDPRALWERLRAEGPPRLPDGGAEAGEVARWLAIWGWHYRQGDWSSGGPVLPGDRRQDTTATATATATAKAGLDVPATVCPDARDVDPHEVARWLYVIKASQNSTGHAYGPHCGGRNPRTGESSPFRLSVNRISIEETPTLPATITPDAREVDPGPALPPGTVVYADPPYLGTTPYAADLPRADVVALARRWAAAGAVVCISEAEPIPELVAEGWHAVRIDGERVGQPRTFSKQQAEWLTLNRAPAWVPSVQQGLFG
jgi:hypothetical protein